MTGVRSSSRQCAGSSGGRGGRDGAAWSTWREHDPPEALRSLTPFLNVSLSNKIHLLEVSLSHHSGSFIDGSWGWSIFPEGPSSVSFWEKDQCLTFWL